MAVVVNVADDTDYCLDTLPGLDASTYTCAGRTAGATYVALLIVLLPDGGYTLANIVRFDLPAAGGLIARRPAPARQSKPGMRNDLRGPPPGVNPPVAGL